MLVRSRYIAAIGALAAMPLSSCFVRHRNIPPPGKVQNRPLLTATKGDLIDRIHRATDPISSFNLRVDLAPSVGALYGGELTDYATVRSYILFRRPDNIRVMGLDPVVHTTTIFDMVSTGPAFRVHIPSKNLF